MGVFTISIHAIFQMEETEGMIQACLIDDIDRCLLQGFAIGR
jgi:hypothetical protein